VESPLIDLPDDVIAIRDTVRRFIHQEVIPRENEIEEKALVPPEIVQQMRELGLFGLTIPEAYGGMGLDSLAYAVVSGEISKANSAIRTLITVNNSIGYKAILLGGTEAQRNEYLPRMARGEFLTSFALTEPGAGSDAQGISTSAVRRGDHWILNGRKHYISHAHRAELFTVFAVTDKEKRARGGISAFLVPKGSPGLSLGKQQDMMGGRGSHPGEVVFEDCEVPAGNLLGDVGFGFKLIQACLNDGRLNLAACAVGAAERLLEMGTEYAKIRHAFGAPIGANQGIQWMLADSATELEASRALVYATARAKDAGRDVDKECAMAKLFATEMVNRVADRVLQIHGGAGYTKELPIERFYRDVRMLTIVEGTSEIQRRSIARFLLGF
jgi:acyl-CoA dehydrogenase